MATLTVWRFDTPEGADQMAEQLERLAGDDLLVLQDAAVVRWPTGEPKPQTRQVTSPAGDGALTGAFWGLLFGLIFLVPLLGAAIGAATGALAGALTDVGIDDHFINQVRDQVTPGTSALFILTSEVVLDQVHEALAGAPRGILIHTDLGPEQEAALRAVFAD